MVLFSAGPASAASIPSDSMTIYNNVGTIWKQLWVTEATEVPGQVYYFHEIGFANPEFYGYPFLVFEYESTSVISDLFGVVKFPSDPNYYLGFASDGEKGGLDWNALPPEFGIQGFLGAGTEGPRGGHFTADMYLSEALLDQGHYADFFSDGDVIIPPPSIPEPASLILLGSGLIGAAGFMRRKIFG